MLAHDSQAQGSGRQNVLQTQLPQRLARLRQRGERLGPACWDINALQLLAEDAAMIADACRTPANSQLAACLDALHETVAGLLNPPQLPGQAASARIAKLIDTLAQQQPPDNTPRASDEATSITIVGATHELGFPLLVSPPDQYWTRLANAIPLSSRSAGAARAIAPTETSAPPKVAINPASIAPKPVAREDTPGVVAGEPMVASSAGRTREQLLRRVSECLAMEDAGIRAGGLLLFSLHDAQARRDLLGAARHDAQFAEVGEFLIAHVGRNDIVANAGDDSFLLFNPDCDPGLLEAYAFNLRDRIAREPFLDDPLQRFLFDVGVCPFVTGATQADAMHEAAHSAIDDARAAGRSGISVVRRIEPAVDAGLLERIRAALHGDGFQLLFQPIVSLRGEEDEQFQVLLRLQGDDQRLHTAAELIPAAERAGLVVAVDRWVLERCIQLLGRRAGDAHAQCLFVSQSLASVRDPGSPDWLRALLLRDGVAGDALCVELSANDATRALADVRRYAIAMKEAGARFTLSGFEAGVLGERLLQALPADFIKLSPRYLRFDDPLVCSELRALVERLQGEGKRVIAPRVEDARGAATLWAAGVDFIQGNFVQEAGADLAFDFQASMM
jgi:EAL domain-containing protein (putative c-di-GMP-specific phosphodiesterase class I)/GGDEF domain-containing protein